MPTELFARQGDLTIEKHDLGHHGDEGFEPHTDFIVAGSSSSSHTLKGPSQIRRSDNRILVRLTAATTLDHADRHLSTPLPVGDYTFTPLRERGGDGDRDVDD